MDDDTVEAVGYYSGLWSALLLRKCLGCDYLGPHSYHLTRFGCWAFKVKPNTGPWLAWPESRSPWSPS